MATAPSTLEGSSTSIRVSRSVGNAISGASAGAVVGAGLGGPVSAALGAAIGAAANVALGYYAYRPAAADTQQTGPSSVLGR
jgi:hypothetical protein